MTKRKRVLVGWIFGGVGCSFWIEENDESYHGLKSSVVFKRRPKSDYRFAEHYKKVRITIEELPTKKGKR